jgi:hypothetical protein
MKPSSPKIQWHRFLAKMFEELLTPLDVTVISDFPVMTNPPEGDILLIRRDSPEWTEEQIERLPDGIRDTRADHILIEFKFTESVNAAAVTQALAYDTFFKKAQKNLDPSRIQTVILSSKTPAKASREALGYTICSKTGVYQSSNLLIKNITLISINELDDSPHNDFVKCFASRKNERKRAFKNLLRSGRRGLTVALIFLINGIMKFLLKSQTGEIAMEKEITPEFVMEIGKDMYEAMLSSIRPEDLIKKFGAEKILSKFQPEERLSGLKPEERLSGLKPEERLSGLKPEERLSGLKPEEIEAYLKKIKKPKG